MGRSVRVCACGVCVVDDDLTYPVLVKENYKIRSVPHMRGNFLGEYGSRTFTPKADETRRFTPERNLRD